MRRYLFPGVFSVGILLFLALWVTYEFLNAYSLKLKEEERIAVTLSGILQETIRSEVRSGYIRIDKLKTILTNIVNTTELEDVRIEQDRKTLVSVCDRPQYKSRLKGKEGYIPQGHLFVLWHTVFLQGDLNSIADVNKLNSEKTNGVSELYLGKFPQKLILVLNTEGYFRDIKSKAQLLLLVFLLGCGGVIILVLAWSFLERSRNLQVELNAAKDRREQIEELSLAAAGLAHETKNPLGIIRGLAQRIADRNENPEESRRMAKEIMEEADVTAARLGDFLSYARLRKPDLSELNAAEYIGRTASLMKDEFANAGVGFNKKIDDVTIMSDPDMLSQILLNLLTNSLRFTEKGDMVNLVLRKTGKKRAVLSISDTGSGISPALLPNIFKPYVSKRPDGYGIGLAIVKRIVEQSGWEINVESRPRQGTKIVISNIKLARAKSKEL